MLPSSHPTTRHPKARRRVAPTTDYRPKTAKLERQKELAEIKTIPEAMGRFSLTINVPAHSTRHDRAASRN
jgi:hypothetical protein